jgi:hypothetical protein
MKKLTFGIVIMAVIAIALGSVGSVFAQSEPPSPSSGPWSGDGRPGRCGGMGDRDKGWMHDEMVSIFAGKLGISESDLEARLDEGESMADIAAAEGLSRDEFITMMRDARAELIDQALKDGKITEQQAKWMKTRGMRMMQRWQEFRGNYGPQNNP